MGKKKAKKTHGHRLLDRLLREANLRSEAVTPDRTPYVSEHIPAGQGIGFYTDVERAQAQTQAARRQEANRAILDRISREIETYPDLRFGQILVNLGIVQVDFYDVTPVEREKIVQDPYNEESMSTLSRLNALEWRREGEKK